MDSITTSIPKSSQGRREGSFWEKTKESGTPDYYEEILRSKTIDIKTRKTEEPIPVVATPDDSEVVGLPKPEVEEIRVEETGGSLREIQ